MLGIQRSQALRLLTCSNGLMSPASGPVRCTGNISACVAGWRRTAALLCCGLGAAQAGHAAFDGWQGVGLRVRVDEKRVLGEVQPESFQAVDLVAQRGLPWRFPGIGGLQLDTRLTVSAGLMHGAGRTAVVLSALPAVFVGLGNSRLTADVGIGLALLSQRRFRQQDFGGPVQGALTFGITLPMLRRVDLAYRFVHYSDAGAYGRGTIGADFHMVELFHRF